MRGRAVFSATSNEHGEVVSIHVLDTEGGRPGWVDAARIALERLKGKKLRVRPGTARTVMKIEATSAWKLPSGRRSGHRRDALSRARRERRGEGLAEDGDLDPVPRVSVQKVELGPGVVVPMPIVEIDLFRLTADPSNLGAKPRRIIHSARGRMSTTL